MASTPAAMQIQPIMPRLTTSVDAVSAKVRIAPTTIRKMPTPMYMLTPGGLRVRVTRYLESTGQRPLTCGDAAHSSHMVARWEGLGERGATVGRGPGGPR